MQEAGNEQGITKLFSLQMCKYYNKYEMSSEIM